MTRDPKVAVALAGAVVVALAGGCYAGVDDDSSEAVAEDDDAEGQAPPSVSNVSCAPMMSVFPIVGPHNIGYDDATCGTGTCEVTCPDANANSDWGGEHHGIDLFAHKRAELVAVADGEVVRVGWAPGSDTSGIRVRLRDTCGWEYYYGHLDEAVVEPGQWVSAGQLIGYMGATGTGAVHTHFNVSPDGGYYNDINPIDLLEATSPTACGGDPFEPPPPPGDGGDGGGGAPPPLPPEGSCGVLLPGQGIATDQGLASCDGRFTLAVQGDGNVVLYHNGVGPLWSSDTVGAVTPTLIMQEDGNLVLYDASGVAIWHTYTYGNAGSYFAVQDDGNLVVYAGATALWDSQTCCR